MFSRQMPARKAPISFSGSKPPITNPTTLPGRHDKRAIVAAFTRITSFAGQGHPSLVVIGRAVLSAVKAVQRLPAGGVPDHFLERRVEAGPASCLYRDAAVPAYRTGLS